MSRSRRLWICALGAAVVLSAGCGSDERVSKRAADDDEAESSEEAVTGASGASEASATQEPSRRKKKRSEPQDRNSGPERDRAASEGGGDARPLVQVLMTPSPREISRAARSAGLTLPVPELRTYSAEAGEADHAAVQMGVLMADLALIAESAPERTDALLTELRAHLQRLGASEDLILELADLQGELRAGLLSERQLIQRLDELSGVAIPELELDSAPWLVPLIQAGSWIESIHLVCLAAAGASDLEPVAGLLSQPEVIRYFQAYVDPRAHGMSETRLLWQLSRTLAVLAELTAGEALTAADLAQITTQTERVLAELR